jgi:hypothetical protein
MPNDGTLLDRLRSASLRSLVGQLEMIHELSQGLGEGAVEPADGEPAGGDLLFDAARRILEQHARSIESGYAGFEELLKDLRRIGVAHGRHYPRRTVALVLSAGDFEGQVVIENTLPRPMAVSFHGGEFVAAPDPAARPGFAARVVVDGGRQLDRGSRGTFDIRVTDVPGGMCRGRYGSDLYVVDDGAIAGLLRLVLEIR